MSFDDAGDVGHAAVTDVYGVSVQYLISFDVLGKWLLMINTKKPNLSNIFWINVLFISTLERLHGYTNRGTCDARKR